MFIKKLIRALQLVDQQGLGLIKNFRSGYSISSTRVVDTVAHHCSTISTIIDVGANRGQFALAAARKFPKSRIISFEPLPDEFERLKQNTRDHKNISVHNLALGEVKGVIDFYRNEHSHASSALVISEEQKSELPETKTTSKIQVQSERLDNVIELENLVHPVLLKLDVQGFEKKVLLGSLSALPFVDFLLFEASFVPMYQEEPLFAEMHDFLMEHGFAIVAPVGHLAGKSNTILQMDFLYRNIRIRG